MASATAFEIAFQGHGRPVSAPVALEEVLRFLDNDRAVCDVLAAFPPAPGQRRPEAPAVVNLPDRHRRRRVSRQDRSASTAIATRL